MTKKRPRTNRDERLIVLVTPDHKKIMQEHADAEELSLSSWARSVLARAIGAEL